MFNVGIDRFGYLPDGAVAERKLPWAGRFCLLVGSSEATAGPWLLTIAGRFLHC